MAYATVSEPAEQHRLGLWPAAEPAVLRLHQKRGITAKGRGFHGFRHTIASKLDEAGALASAIGALPGHRTGGRHWRSSTLVGGRCRIEWRHCTGSIHRQSTCLRV